MSLLSIVQETSVKYSEPSCNVYGKYIWQGPIYLTSFKPRPQPGKKATLDDSDHVNCHMTACIPRWLLISFALAH